MGNGHGTILLRERRQSRRFPTPLRVELWSDEKSCERRRERMKDISLRGFYFFSEISRAPGALLNFSVRFVRRSTGQEVDLLRGIARVIRCDEHPQGEAEPYGMAARIEETTYEYGETGAPPESQS